MFTGILFSDSKRLIHKKSSWFGLGLFSFLAILTLSFFYYNLYGNLFTPTAEVDNAFYQYVKLFQGDSFVAFFLPLYLTIIIGTIFLQEKQSTFLSYILNRSQVKPYIYSKILSLSIISFSFTFVLFFLLFLICLFLFPSNAPIDGMYLTLSYIPNLYLSQPTLYVMLLIFNLSLTAVFLTIYSFIGSLLFQNKYIVYIFPVILFYGTDTLMNIAGDVLNIFLLRFLAPTSMIIGYLGRDIPWWIVPLYWIVLIIIGVYVFNFTLKKSLVNEQLI